MYNIVAPQLQVGQSIKIRAGIVYLCVAPLLGEYIGILTHRIALSATKHARCMSLRSSAPSRV